MCRCPSSTLWSATSCWLPRTLICGSSCSKYRSRTGPDHLRSRGLQSSSAVPPLPGLAAASHNYLIILAKEANKQNQTLRKSACVCNGVPASGSPSSPLPPTSCRQPEAGLTTVETVLWAPQVQVVRRARSQPPLPQLPSSHRGGTVVPWPGSGALANFRQHI